MRFVSWESQWKLDGALLPKLLPEAAKMCDHRNYKRGESIKGLMKIGKREEVEDEKFGQISRPTRRQPRVHDWLGAFQS